MSFWQKLFGAVSDSAADVEFDDLDHPARQAEPVGSDAASTPQAGDDSAAVGDMPVGLLDAILQVINEQLPPVAAECINADAQRRFLARRLGQPLADYGEALRRNALSQLTGDRARMQTELEELRAERKEVAGKREEQKAALLSEQRQRRALSDRNRDLEAKIDELASEIEQHKLTVASLMNKLRVAEVAEGDSSALREEIESLKARLAEKDTVIASKDEEIVSLTEKIADLESASAIDTALQQRRQAAGETEPDAPAADDAAAPKRRRGRPRKRTAGIYNPDDDASADLDSVDWLLPGGEPAARRDPAPDPDFGYQPPKQSPAPDSDAQLTLF